MILLPEQSIYYQVLSCLILKPFAQDITFNIAIDRSALLL